MKFKIKKSILLNKLSDVAKAISSKNIIPILSGIKFELTKEKLILTASDNDITIETFIPVDKENLIIETTGSIIIKGRYILDIVRKLSNEFINIEVIDGYKVLIYTENSEFNLNGINSKEYPIINLELTNDPVIIDKSAFKKIINQTVFATSLDESRIILTGVNFRINKDILECTATDSYRLSYKKIILDNKNKEIDVIVPNRNLLELMKLVNDEDSAMEIHIFNNKIIFKFDEIIFQSRIINESGGAYPDTSKIIAEEPKFEIVINKLDFFGMIDRASILNNDKDNNIVTLEINNKEMKITSMSLEIGKVEEKYNIDCKNKIKISFNSKYMMDAIKALETENIRIFFIEEIRPIIMKEEDNDNLLELIQSIRTY
ncbi:MAG TPA: DNA polymerase III subunit beta [Bacilli bacterium]|nr:DNA polymerase III subunit beta [Bacilli bacterium]